MFKKMLSWLLIAIMTINHLAWAQSRSESEADRPVNYTQAMSRLSKLMDLFEELRSHIDRSQFDTEALLDRLEYDRQRIIEFVRDEIYFEQYPGLLRGTRGTLSSRAGNALDQSLLLAQLLKGAGFDARIVRGVLTEDQAVALLGKVTMERSPRRPIGDIQEMKSAVQRFCHEISRSCPDVEKAFGELSDGDSPEQRRLIERYRLHKAHLLKILDESGMNLETGASIQPVVEEARDYYWVEFRGGPSESWNDVHPAFGRRIPGDLALARSEVYADEIPASLAHKFGFEVIVEQQLGERKVRHVLVPWWERPAANLQSEPITFQISSLNFTASARNASFKFDQRALESDLFLPSFSAGQVSAAFDFAGNAVPLDAAASAYAGIFLTASSKVNEAAGALSQIGSSTQDMRSADTRSAKLSSIVAQYTTIGPDRKKHTSERIIYDERFPDIVTGGLSSADVTSLDVYRAIARTYTFQVSTGEVAAAQAIDDLLESVLERKLSLEMIARFEHLGEEDVDFSTLQDIGDQISWVGLHTLIQLFDERPLADPEDVIYRHRPNVLVHYRTLPFDGVFYEAIDIVQNGRRSFAKSGERVRLSPASIIEAGVWETVSEGTLIGAGGHRSLFTAAGAIEAKRSDNMPFLILQPSDKARVANLKMPNMSREAMMRDLADGFAVVLADPAVDGSYSGQPAWWRVHTESGETVGVGFNGEGAALTEGLVTKILIGLGVVVIVYSICTQVAQSAGNLNKETERLCRNNSLAVGGIFVALAFGMYWALLGVVNLTFNMATD